MSVDQPSEISKVIRKLSRLYRTSALKFLKDLDLTKPQLMAIFEIYNEPKTIGQLSEALLLSYSTVSGIVDRLERDGFAERIRDQADRRIIWIKKTEKVGQFKSLIDSYTDDYYGAILRDLSPEQVESIIRALNLLSEQFEKHVNDPETICD
ncbi:MarR family winged helix-turn-helix transcriptional regulator [Paenibacillus allorhizosphaerae]|uniref:HTH marR-type domain-containing protein n=1 Tax=Paenibacillus allorhizosphaerae TaxID=2849866 RepID=A0ABN7TVS0_9BACL|nr:MarR family transcriptional regulator [Paenibacillus allorhizosphaerae]CAG7653852.1 hypothetical protein PAECIP111802_05600 [Paenibacillus allorhizosphaerae]